MQISAAVVRAPNGAFQQEHLELDDPRPDEVRVRMVAAGVCHTDVLVRDQVYPTPLPAVLGHEGAGVVEAVGCAVRGLAPGDHVVLSVNTCGRCGLCLSGALAYCEELYPSNFGGRRRDGSVALTDFAGNPVSSHFFGQSSFATRANVAERAVVKVPGDVPLELVGPLGCGIQTGAGAVFNTLRPTAGSSIAIFGGGAVGCSALLAALSTGCTTIVVVDINDDRLARAAELGATHTVNSSRQDPAEAIMSLTAGRGVEVALEATGVPGVLRQAADSLAVRGTVGLVGAGRPGTEAAFETGLSITRGWTLKMIIEGDAVPQVFIPRLLALWRQGRFPFDQLIDRFRFEDINKAFASSESGESIKPVVVFDGQEEA
ncbi:NAD(P)-dependent alcohol dehydrogenase [Streptomyces mexicanus]|uniref:NAD(P)-dependent alcohol dehydrogenase n=1 Tax=Streptomyces mexicanus TaxID=178566 RepID=UPI003675248E